MWPGKYWWMLVSKQVADGIAQDSKKNLYAYNIVKNMDVKCNNLISMLNRSCFLSTPVKRLGAAFTESNFEASDDVIKMVGSQVDGIDSTNSIEDLNNLQKNSGQSRGSMGFRRPENSMAVGLANRRWETRHL